jgi:hypothetical protein
VAIVEQQTTSKNKANALLDQLAHEHINRARGELETLFAI